MPYYYFGFSTNNKNANWNVDYKQQRCNAQFEASQKIIYAIGDKQNMR